MDSTFTFDFSDATSDEVDASNKRPRTEGDPNPRRSPVEQDRVAQRKKPAASSTQQGLSSTILRITLPLPRTPTTTMALASSRYDSGDFEGLLAAVGENPHRQLTRRGEPPLAPTNLAQLGIPDKIFPHVHVPTFRIFGNVIEDQVRRVREIANPKVAIVVHGGGQDINTTGGPLRDKITKLLSDLSFPPSKNQQMPIDNAEAAATTLPSTQIRIYLAQVRTPKKSNTFGQPWTWFADLGPDAEWLRQWLLYQEVFPITPTLSFSVHPLDELIQPYAVEDTPQACQQFAKEIKDYVWKDRDFTVSTAHQVEANWGLHGDPATLLKLVTNTINVVCVTAELKTSRKEVPAYLVYIKPVTNDTTAYLKWAKKFTKTEVYWRGPCMLEVDKASVDCKLCKDTSHCAHECPLNVEGWKGTAVKDIYTRQELEARTAGASTAEEETAGQDWQQVKARRAERDSRPPKSAKATQRNRRPTDHKGKGRDDRR
ncbi:hypothetical protein DICSQDRAFT_170828 [Dichomitus squalens LYAD-421 SS1]|uniref:Uncharacterized protein n=1 Tax=Dichomitus squalens (strain LYAD-421) TaxID=732165 RepID=R7SX83_DICSQ|nr:uncharacterized protein DICSQDRAFT_170828 [Dichomitus squalens LYAD-421 SS1]EJF60676.1 hypothetical protein DICSQDRAFT_170828 [Dichomitus squalens LYAD-421 SS1]